MSETFGLTPRQSEALGFIKSFSATNGYAPSFVEIATAIGVSSKSSVHRLVHGLADRGLVRLLPDAPRSIALIEKQEQV